MRPMTNVATPKPGALMTIGEASRRSGFTVKALRFYERRGIGQVRRALDKAGDTLGGEPIGAISGIAR